MQCDFGYQLHQARDCLNSDQQHLGCRDQRQRYLGTGDRNLRNCSASACGTACSACTFGVSICVSFGQPVGEPFSQPDCIAFAEPDEVAFGYTKPEQVTFTVGDSSTIGNSFGQPVGQPIVFAFEFTIVGASAFSFATSN